MIEIPMTPDVFRAKRQQLAQEHDIHLDGDEGKLTKSGVTAAYRYAGGLLRVDILEKPFFVTTQYCEDELRRFVG